LQRSSQLGLEGSDLLFGVDRRFRSSLCCFDPASLVSPLRHGIPPANAVKTARHILYRRSVMCQHERGVIDAAFFVLYGAPLKHEG
jgi:hypothetical protein